MTAEKDMDAALKNLASSGLETCLKRISAVSAGTWTLASTEAADETLRAALKRHPFRSGQADAVHLGVQEKHALSALMLFEPEDLECVSMCFLGYAFPKGGEEASLTDEVMLLELGNIVLNSFVSSAANALGKVIIPTVPAYTRGDLPYLEVKLTPDLKPFRIVSASLDLRHADLATRVTVLFLLPEEIAKSLPSAPCKPA